MLRALLESKMGVTFRVSIWRRVENLHLRADTLSRDEAAATGSDAGSGAADLPPLIAGRVGMACETLAALPGFRSFVEKLPEAIRVVEASVVQSESMPQALKSIMVQATNECFDLVAAAAMGEGRSALKSSRSLFDLHVTALDVSGDAVAAERYENHRWVVWNQWAQLNLEQAYLYGNDRKAHDHQAKVALRESQSEADRAIGQYGAAYRRSWINLDLRSRATNHGIESRYDLYRLASAVLHGSAGGAIGIHVQHDENVGTYRTGPALALAPIAVLAGLQDYGGIISVVENAGAIGAPVVREEILRGLEAWPEYRSYILRLDATWWAHAPRHDVLGVLSVGPGLSRVWYLHDPLYGIVRRAKPPVLNDVQQSSLDALVNKIRAEVPDAARAKQPIGIAVEGSRPEPLIDAPWMNAGVVLVQRPLEGWQGAVTPDDPRHLGPDDKII
jgi:hypothetical protein